MTEDERHDQMMGRIDAIQFVLTEMLNEMRPQSANRVLQNARGHVIELPPPHPTGYMTYRAGVAEILDHLQAAMTAN